MDKTLLDAVAVANEYGLPDRELATVVEAATAARREALAQPGLVPLTHPVSGGQILASPEAVAVLELSGWTGVAEPPPEDDDGLPKGNASRDEWETYALGHGKTEDDLDGLSRDEIRDLFLNTEEN